MSHSHSHSSSPHSHSHSQPSHSVFNEEPETSKARYQRQVNERFQRELEKKQRDRWDEMSQEEKNVQEEAEHFQDIVNAYNFYGTHTFKRFKIKEEDFDRMTEEFKSLLPGFKQKMKDVRTAVVKNHFFIRQITANTEIFLNGQAQNIVGRYEPPPPSEHNMEKVRSTLRQCMRDWSESGAAEREQCYQPILNELTKLFPDVDKRQHIKILNPGCGLGRLTWEIASLGFQSQGNEFSYFMLLASNTLLNRSTTGQYTIYPFIHETCNVMKLSDQLKEVTIPDVDPCSLPPTCKFSMAAGDFVEVYGEADHYDDHWDCVAACFFLDTAHNIMEYLQVLSKVIKVGGYLISFGPLLFHFADIENEMSLEISYEELRPAFEYFGLKIIKEEFDVPSSYAQNPNSLLQMRYRCIFSVCVRVADCPADKAAAQSRKTAAERDEQPKNKHSKIS